MTCDSSQLSGGRFHGFVGRRVRVARWDDIESGVQSSSLSWKAARQGAEEAIGRLNFEQTKKRPEAAPPAARRCTNRPFFQDV